MRIGPHQPDAAAEVRRIFPLVTKLQPGHAIVCEAPLPRRGPAHPPKTHALRQGTGRLRGEKGRGRLRGMSTLSTLPTDPKELRPLLHAEVDKLRDENLLVLHQVALELELDEVTERLNVGFDADRAAGKLARLPELIREARAALAARRAS